VSTDREEYRSGFAQSDEALVFGAEPEFDDCFVAGGPESLFWTRRDLAWSVKTEKILYVPRRTIVLQAPAGSSIMTSSSKEHDDA